MAWVNDLPSDESQAPPDPEPSRRKNFLAARNCVKLDAEAGAPTSVYEELDEALARRVMRHVWESAPGDRERTIVTCVDGKVARVDRTPMP